jgi:hypothetical protein
MSDSPARFQDLCLDAVDHDTGLISWDVLADPEGNDFCVFAPE